MNLLREMFEIPVEPVRELKRRTLKPEWRESDEGKVLLTRA